MAKRILKPSTALYPTPVVLVSCGTPAEPNILTLAWAGVVCGDPPMVSLAIRPSRHSHGLIKATQEFVVNMPTADQLEKVDYCGMVSGRQVNKFAICGFTPIAGSVVNAPMIAECPVNLECTVYQILSLGVHDLFLGRIVAVHGDETVLDEKGQVDLSRANAIAYVTHNYYRVAEHLGSYGFTKGRLT